MPTEFDWKAYQNFLVFPNSNIRVPLARSATELNQLSVGFDPTTLKLQWLKPDELLWIHWTTLYQGSGGYTHDGNAILQVGESGNRELFRDYFESVGRAGWMAQYSSCLEITYNDRRKTFRLTRSTREVWGDMGAPDPKNPLPFTVISMNDDGKAFYLSTVDTSDTWTYKLSVNKLKFLHGSSAVEVSDEAKGVEEIVTGFHVSRAELERMNPRLRLQQKVTGLVTLNENCAPYLVSTDDDGFER